MGTQEQLHIEVSDGDLSILCKHGTEHPVKIKCTTNSEEKISHHQNN